MQGTVFKSRLICILIASLVSAGAALAQTENQYSTEVALRLEQGTLLLDQGELVRARAEFEAALKIDPEVPEAYNNLGLTYYRAGDLKRAAEAYEKAIAINPLFSASISNLAAVRYQEKRLKEAAQLFNLALSIVQGKDPQLQYNLANVLRDSKQYGEACKHYLQAIKLKPDFHSAYNGLGAVYYCQEDYDRAEKEVRKAISLKSDYSLAYYHLGLILSAKNRLDEALNAYQRSLEYEKNKAYRQDTQTKIEELRVLIARRQGTPDTGVRDASVGGVRRDVVSTMLSRGEFSSAERELKGLVDGDYRKDPSAWNNYGFALMKQKKDQGSIVAFKKAIDLSRGDLVEAHYNLAQTLRRRGDYLGAERECRQAMAMAAKHEQLCPLVHNLHGLLLKRSGRLKEADAAYSLAIAQSMGKLSVAHYNRAIVLERLNKTREAAAEYKTYLKEAPTGANAERARARLRRLGM